VYSSIYVRPSDRRQGLCVHYSNADGSSWTGPLEITPSFVANQSADKPFIDVNPNTGRILVTWSQFATVSVSILPAYSDDGEVTWSTSATLATATGSNIVQASEPRFLP